MTSPQDYTERYHAYMRAWHQVLEPLAAMAAAWPMPDTPMAMPGYSPPVPPAGSGGLASTPGDYAQQLFGQLQSWRQYLEQMTGGQRTMMHPPVPYPAKTPDYGPAGAQPQYGPAGTQPQGGNSTQPQGGGDGAAPAAQPGGTSAAAALAAPPGSGPTPPPDIAVKPTNDLGNQSPYGSRNPVRPGLVDQSISVPFKFESQAAKLARGPIVSDAPVGELGARVADTRPARLDGGERLQRTPDTLTTGAAEPLVARTARFKGLAERAAANPNLG